MHTIRLLTLLRTIIAWLARSQPKPDRETALLLASIERLTELFTLWRAGRLPTTPARPRVQRPHARNPLAKNPRAQSRPQRRATPRPPRRTIHARASPPNAA